MLFFMSGFTDALAKRARERRCSSGLGKGWEAGCAPRLRRQRPAVDALFFRLHLWHLTAGIFLWYKFFTACIIVIDSRRGTMDPFVNPVPASLLHSCLTYVFPHLQGTFM